jgi:hypothetical protein
VARASLFRNFASTSAVQGARVLARSTMGLTHISPGGFEDASQIDKLLPRAPNHRYSNPPRGADTPAAVICGTFHRDIGVLRARLSNNMQS